jgi:ribonuclease P protein component
MERLKRRTDFRAAATGARAPARAFVVQARARGKSGPSRVGFTVSKQVGNAVERNRVRRRLREIVRLSGTAALRAGHDYVLIGRRNALAAPFGEMMADFAKALHRVHQYGERLHGGTGGAGQRSLHDAESSLSRENIRNGAAGPRKGAAQRSAAATTAKSPE